MTPIKHKRFLGSNDSEWIDSEDQSPEFLAESVNLSPFRKIGSLQQCSGHSEIYDNLPIIAGYSPIQLETFSIDKDNKEINFLTYQNADGLTKMFINPFFNPPIGWANHSGAYAENSWIEEWQELTEKITVTINTIDINNFIFTVDSALLNNDYQYYNGFFILNDYVSDVPPQQFNFVKNYVPDEMSTIQTFITQTKPTGWQAGHSITLYRYPVSHFYSTDLPTPELPNYSNSAIFNAVPTQYLSSQNELRIACGKEKRPLILTFLYEKKYFFGAESTSWHGFWFGLQQIPQVLYKSYVSPYADSVVASASNICYFVPLLSSGQGGNSHWIDLTVSTDHIKFAWTGEVPVTLVWENRSDLISRAEVIAAGYTPMLEFTQSGVVKCRFGFKTIGQKYYFAMVNSPPGSPNTIAYFYSALWIYFNLYYGNSNWTITKGGAVNPATIESTIGNPVEYTLQEGDITISAEAGGNIVTQNLFLGVMSRTVKKTITAGQISLPFIMTVLYDSRNEVIVSQGRMYVNPDSQTNTYPDAYELRFITWFDRRITHINYYSGEPHTIPGGNTAPSAYVLEKASYPYFGWSKDVKINEVPLNRLMRIDDITKAINGELAIDKYARDITIGQNCFGLNTTYGYWFIKYGKDVSGFPAEEKGKGLKFIVNANRFIDQDITMNYTRIARVGAINGRFFITGVKNTVEGEFSFGDTIIYSNYSVGIANYDIFLRTKQIIVSSGNKDTCKDILYSNGYLMVIKETNVYYVDIRSGNELEYRVVDTMNGRGVRSYDQTCLTPYGIVICSSDGVWLITNEQANPILTGQNGRLQLYLDKFAEKNFKIVYYHEKDELLVFSTDQTAREGSIVHILVYNFQFQAWTTYEYENSANPIDLTINSEKDIIILNYENSSVYNIIKINENATSFVKPDGSIVPIKWRLKTHSYPYSDYEQDIQLQWIQSVHDYSNTADRSIKVKVTTDNDADILTDYYVLENTASSVKKNSLKKILINPTLCKNLTIEMSNVDSNGTTQEFAKFALHNLILWITGQSEKKITN